MNCPKCGFQNPPDAKYCQKCANVFVSSNQSNQSNEPKIEVMPQQEEQKYQALTPSHENIKNYKSKSFKTIIFILLGIVIVGGLVYAGYYYKDEIFGTKIKENLEQENGDGEVVEEQGLIYGNYEQLILTEQDVQEKFWFLVLDENESKEIRNISELNFEEFSENEIDASGLSIIGGYQNIFGVDYDKVFARIERGELESELSAMNFMSDKVIIFNTVNDSQRYFIELKKNFTKDVEKIVQDSGGDIDKLLISLNNIGDEGFRFNLYNPENSDDKSVVFTLIFFRIKNTINILDITGEGQYFTEDNISYLLKKIENKYKNYIPSSQVEEISYSLDSDNDGLKDYIEERHETDKNNPDTDGDGYTDGDEVKNCYNPLGLGRLIEDNLIKLLTDKSFLEAQNLYYLKPDEDIKKFEEEKGHLSGFVIIRIGDIKTGIFVPENKRYYLIISGDNEITGEKFYFDEKGFLEVHCVTSNRAMSLSDEDNQKCQMFNDTNNFEIDCVREIE